MGLTIEQIRIIARCLANSNHGDFLKTLAEAVIRADGDNLNILRESVSEIFTKYQLEIEYRKELHNEQSAS